VFENVWNLEIKTMEAERCANRASQFVLFANVRLVKSRERNWRDMLHRRRAKNSSVW
jgi:hypothetical protein